MSGNVVLTDSGINVWTSGAKVEVGKDFVT